MAVAQASNSKGRNVEPMSSVLKIHTLDSDVSAFTAAPLDGEWVIFQGQGKAAASSSGESSTAIVAATKDTPGNLGLARMVWSEQGRSDIQATGRKRVPVVFQDSFHCKLELYEYTVGSLPQAGWLITLGAPHATEGDLAGQKRIIAKSNVADLGAGYHWCVGIVIATVTTAGDPLECMLWDSPRLITIADA